MTQYRRTYWEKVDDRRMAMTKAEAQGKVADSMEYRLALMKRVESGEITLAQAQDELKRVKRAAKRNGLLTRNQAYMQG